MTSPRLVDQINVGGSGVDVIDSGMSTNLNHAHDEATNQKMWQSVTGSSSPDLHPSQVKLLHGEVWLKVIQMHRPGSEDLTVITKPMLRHRGVALDGKVHLFQQGRGEVVRFGSASSQEEWVAVHPDHIMGEITVHKDFGPRISKTGKYVTIFPHPLPKSGGLIEEIQPDHVMSTQWAFGEAVTPFEGGYLHARVVYLTERATEVVIGNKIFFSVPLYDILGVCVEDLEELQ